MSNNTITFILGTLSYVSDSIFTGVKILIPLILIVKILKPDIKKPDISCLTTSTNLLILTGGLLFLGALATNILATLRTGGREEMDFMISVVTGKQWYQFVIPLLNFGILPNLFWMKKFRNSFYTSFYLVMFWFATYFLVLYISNKEKALLASSASHSGFPFSEYAGKMLLFIVLINIFYFFVNRKKI